MSELRLGAGNYPAMGVAVPSMGAPGGALGSMGQFAQIQNALNQNVLFQQTLGARLRAGEIIAGSPDMETAMQNMYRDPHVAPFAPQIANEYRQYQLTSAQIGGQLQTQANDAMQLVMKNLPGLYNSPENWPAVVQTAKSVTNPQVWPRVQQAMESIRTSLTAPMPDGSPVTGDMFHQRLSGMMLPHMTAEQYSSIVGKPEMVELGGVKQPMLAVPGRGFMPAGAPLQVGIPPQVRTDIPTPSGAPLSGIVTGSGQVTPLHIGPPGPQAPAGGPGPQASAGGVPAGGVPAGGLVPGAGGSMPPAGSALMGATPSQIDYGKEVAKQAIDRQNELSTLIQGGNMIMQTVAEARSAMGSFTPGGGASTYVRLAQYAQALGASKSLVDRIGNGDLAASQEFQKLMVNTTMGQIRQQLQGIGGSRLSNLEFQTFERNNPNIDTDPRAIEKIFDFWTKLHQINLMEQPALAQYINGGGNPTTWDTEWTNRVRGMGLLPLSTRAGVPGTAAAPGIAAAPPQAPKPTHRYNPATGTIEPMQ